MNKDQKDFLELSHQFRFQTFWKLTEDTKNNAFIPKSDPKSKWWSTLPLKKRKTKKDELKKKPVHKVSCDILLNLEDYLQKNEKW